VRQGWVVRGVVEVAEVQGRSRVRGGAESGERAPLGVPRCVERARVCVGAHA
jgi:hypothetical protein